MDARSAAAEFGEDGGGEGATPRLVLDGFSGPLALLLDMARTRQIDLAQLPMADLVDQLATALQEAGPSLGEKGNWLVMACWLLLLRSRVLLAADAPAQQEVEETTDELRARLLDLRAAQVLASWLERRRQLGRDVFARGRPELLGASVGPWRSSRMAPMTSKLPPPTAHPGSTCGRRWTLARASCSCWQKHRTTRRSIGSCRKSQPRPRSRHQPLFRCSDELPWPAR